MNLGLKDKKVFISGSTKGIGFETARLFLEEGSTVIINGRTSESVKYAIDKLDNKNVSGIVADFLNDDQIDDLINRIPNDIDIIINNVGIFKGQDFQSETIKDWDDHFKVNLMSGVRLSKHFLPMMLKKTGVGFYLFHLSALALFREICLATVCQKPLLTFSQVD